MRQVSVDCDVCGTEMPLEQAKEALIKRGENAYKVVDLCAPCLDTLLQQAESVNDTEGYRQRAAALIAVPDNAIPQHRAAS
jgi:hypothetical protein